MPNAIQIPSNRTRGGRRARAKARRPEPDSIQRAGGAVSEPQQEGPREGSTYKAFDNAGGSQSAFRRRRTMPSSGPCSVAYMESEETRFGSRKIRRAYEQGAGLPLERRAAAG